MKTKPVYLLPGGPDSQRGELTEDCRAALQANGKQNPTVAYVGTATLDDRSFFRMLAKPILDAGAGDVVLAPIAGRRADIKAARKILAESDAIFLSGGEVDDGMKGLVDSGLDVFLSELYRGGKFFFGISAGCIMMGRYYAHWDVEGDNDTASLFPCLGFVPMNFDAHDEENDWDELQCVVRMLGGRARGYGLSTGGLYTANPQGRLKSFRNGPSVFLNVRGVVQRKG